MAYKHIGLKTYTWHHFSGLEEKDFQIMEHAFKFHPLDYDDVRDATQLPKLDVYKHYLFLVIALPVFHQEILQITKVNLSIFVGPDYIVTASEGQIDAVNRYFVRLARSTRMKRELTKYGPGFLLYKLLDYVFRDAKVILQEVVREVNDVEEAVYDDHTRVATKRLGMVRRNVLYLRHVIDPQRIIMQQLQHVKRTFLPTTLANYFDDIGDTLDGIWVVTDNLKNIVDGLFDVNEAFLSHRTNEIIRLLTIISVVLMPATLLTGYYGMNVDHLPFGNNPLLVTAVILLSIILFLLVIIRIDKRN
ncbi:MAG: magnesium transporter CorA family protein [bacterium]|nr:magnesium transporter CorA family protein [bacterium]MDA1024424.1 magnesium transporter CorA family protein [bacterium]